MMNNYLLDKDFLLELDNCNEKEVYVKIIALSKNEIPLESIEGRVTGGSVNVDGSSAVRRTCNINLVAQDININEFYWGLENKFKLEIGLKNKVNSQYPDIIWFNMGIYIITQFNTSQNVNSYTINVSGKDKMCLLNGEVSGALPHTTDFGQLDEIDAEGNRTIKKLSIKDILFNMVQEIGEELPWNIIIEDIDDFGLELLEYRGDRTLYLIKEVSSDTIVDICKNGDKECWIINKDNTYTKTIVSRLNYETSFDLNQIADIVIFNDPSNKEQEKYTVFKINYGDICGYRETELVYAGDLIANVGESITSVLDKIKEMLGNYEYFYNIDGQFVFRKKLYLSNIKIEEVSSNVVNVFNQDISYQFLDGILINSFSNNPDILNLKNDFSVWGTYKTQYGSELPISMRYAIDRKPQSYTPIRPIKTTKWQDNGRIDGLGNMILDLYEQPNDGKDNDFDIDKIIAEYNSFKEERRSIVEEVIEEAQRKLTITNYLLDNKKYYTHILEERTKEYYDVNRIKKIDAYYIDYPITINDYDWRELIYQMSQDYAKEFKSEDFYSRLIEKNYIEAQNRDDEFSKNIVTNFYYSNGKTGYEPYYIDIRSKWRDLYDIQPDADITDSTHDDLIRGDELENIYIKSFYEYKDDRYITWDILENLYVLYNDGKNKKTFYPFIDYYCKIEDKKDELTVGQNYWYFLNANDLSPQGKTNQVSILKDKDIRDLYIYIDDNSNIPTIIFEGIFYTKPLDDWDGDKEKIKFRTATKEGGLFYGADFPIQTSEKSLIKTGYLSSQVLATGKKMVFYENYTNYVWYIYNKLKADKNISFYLKNTSDDIDKLQLFAQYTNSELLIKDQSHPLYEFYKEPDKIFEILKDIYWNEELQTFNKYLPKWEKTNIFKESFEQKEYVEELIDYYYGKYDYFLSNTETHPSRKYWAKQRYNNPSQLTFWLDFLDADNSELQKVSVPVVGSRKKSLQDNNVKRVFYEQIPEIIFISNNRENNYTQRPGYTYINLSDDLYPLFTISSKGKSAKEVIEELLYKHSCATETINIKAIPIYYLEPNYKILVRDSKSSINGEYIINKISYQFNYNGLMTIDAVKFYEEF